MSWDVWIIRPPEGVEKVSDLSSESVLSPFNRREVHAAAQAAFGRVEIGRIGIFAPVDLVDASFLRFDGPDVYADLGLGEATRRIGSR